MLSVQGSRWSQATASLLPPQQAVTVERALERQRTMPFGSPIRWRVHPFVHARPAH